MVLPYWGSSPISGGIVRVYLMCAFLPLIGLLAVFLPDLRQAPGKGVTMDRVAVRA
ncbi:hypothetical protein [Thiorhodovibrio winogradskyi]|uniref:hypothetical protein n=1 Tax=Thiorhodovibrio winogradskyi TaxID=77007 RepID=UPI002E2B945B|nr:hypothetical protein [Thiorhodovibrio winogradskyi]